MAKFDAVVRELVESRARHRHGSEVLNCYQAREDTQQLWMAVRDEWNVRSGTNGCDGWNIWVAPDGTSHRHLSFFESRSFKVDKREAERLFALQDLVDHFQIPEAPDVAACPPSGFEQYVQRLGEREVELEICGQGLPTRFRRRKKD